MPNQPKYPLMAARVPTDAAEELRAIAEETGMRTGEIIAAMVRSVGKRYRRHGRVASREQARRRLIGRSVKSAANPRSRRNAG